MEKALVSFFSLGVKAKIGYASNLHRCIKLVDIIEFKESSNIVPNVLFSLYIKREILNL